MSTPGAYRVLVALELVLAVATFVALRFVRAPYGRYATDRWGPTVPARLGWLVMESPAALVFAAVYATGAHRSGAVPVVLLVLWQTHYAYRAFVYPWTLRGSARMPAVIALMAIAFNLLNAYVNARWVSELGSYPLAWLADPRFLAGTALFLGGLAVNRDADRRLRALRGPSAGDARGAGPGQRSPAGDARGAGPGQRPPAGGYQIPHGGLYRWVSCPNYLGEIVQWFGWALLTWSPAGLAFAVYTTANLLPRGIDHHAWYRERFDGYPAARRAVIPYVL
jgi:steroid 5-alpha reductase family enzyme